jgi:hypothetical protein
MSIELTEEQRGALDAAGDVPARVITRDTGAVCVLLRWGDYEWVRGLVPELPDAARALDPRTQLAYALLPEPAYERIKALFEDDPLTPAEQEALLREAGERAGWDDPDLDVYEEYRERP